MMQQSKYMMQDTSLSHYISNLLVVRNKYKCSRNKNNMIDKNFFIFRGGRKTLAYPGLISYHWRRANN